MTDARIDQVNVEALVQGASTARLDAVRPEVLITFAVDVMLDAAAVEALVPIESVGAAERPWFAMTLTQPVKPMILWLPDTSAVPQIRMGWGIILN